MMERPLVSIIVPIYKVESFLDECVNSLVKQTYQNLEIILVDDGSPDRCPSMCDEWAKKDDRVKVFHKENAGLSAARNYGISKATGEYLMFVDSDDYLKDNAVMESVTNIGDSDMLAFGCYEFFEKEGNKGHDINFSKTQVVDYHEYWNEYFKSRLDFIYIVAWNKLYKKEVFDRLRYTPDKINEDARIIESVINECDKITLLNEALYCYRRRGESITSTAISSKNYDAVEARLTRTREFLDKDEVYFAAQALKETDALLDKFRAGVESGTTDHDVSENRYLKLRKIYDQLLEEIIQKRKVELGLE